MPAPRPLRSLRGLPAMVADHTVGTVVCALLDRDRMYMLGFEVESLAGRRYFLPLALSRVTATGVVASSPLHLVDDVDYYVRRGAAPGDEEDDTLAVELATGKVVSAESSTALGSATPR